MTDNADLIADARNWATSIRHDDRLGADTLDALADALATRDAACGHLSSQLVAKVLDQFRRPVIEPEIEFSTAELAALRAATFEVTE